MNVDDRLSPRAAKRVVRSRRPVPGHGTIGRRARARGGDSRRTVAATRRGIPAPVAFVGVIQAPVGGGQTILGLLIWNDLSTPSVIFVSPPR